jgi:hypothetical protein
MYLSIIMLHLRDVCIVQLIQMLFKYLKYLSNASDSVSHLALHHVLELVLDYGQPIPHPGVIEKLQPICHTLQKAIDSNSQPNNNFCLTVYNISSDLACILPIPWREMADNILNDKDPNTGIQHMIKHSQYVQCFQSNLTSSNIRFQHSTDTFTSVQPVKCEPRPHRPSVFKMPQMLNEIKWKYIACVRLCDPQYHAHDVSTIGI